MDPTILTASAIASLAFQKFLESGTGELGKKFTTDAIAKMDTLLKRIWSKLRGKPQVEEIKTSIEQTHKMTPEQIDQIATYLQVVMDEDFQFADEIQLLTKEIKAGKLIDQSNVNQNIFEGQGWQAKVNEGNVYQAETMNITQT